LATDASNPDTVDTTIPKLKPALAQKHWWSRELADRCREVRRMAHMEYGRRTELEDLAHHGIQDSKKGLHRNDQRCEDAHWEDILTTIN